MEIMCLYTNPVTSYKPSICTFDYSIGCNNTRDGVTAGEIEASTADDACADSGGVVASSLCAGSRESLPDDTFPGGPPPSGDLDSTSYGDYVFVHKSGHKLQTIYLYR
jgi:hypothetical protein